MRLRSVSHNQHGPTLAHDDSMISGNTCCRSFLTSIVCCILPRRRVHSDSSHIAHFILSMGQLLMCGPIGVLDIMRWLPFFQVILIEIPCSGSDEKLAQVS